MTLYGTSGPGLGPPISTSDSTSLSSVRVTRQKVGFDIFIFRPGYEAEGRIRHLYLPSGLRGRRSDSTSFKEVWVTRPDLRFRHLYFDIGLRGRITTS